MLHTRSYAHIVMLLLQRQLQELQRALDEREERIQGLESDQAQWKVVVRGFAAYTVLYVVCCVFRQGIHCLGCLASCRSEFRMQRLLPLLPMKKWSKRYPSTKRCVVAACKVLLFRPVPGPID